MPEDTGFKDEISLLMDKVDTPEDLLHLSLGERFCGVVEIAIYVVTSSQKPIPKIIYDHIERCVYCKNEYPFINHPYVFMPTLFDEI